MTRTRMVALLFLLTISAVMAQDAPVPAPMPAEPKEEAVEAHPEELLFPRALFASRRDRLYDEIGDDVAILLGAQTPPAYLGFRQNNTFFYFTGVETPECYLIADGKARKSWLFVPDRLPMDPGERKRVRAGGQGETKTGIDHVVSRKEFSGVLEEILSQDHVEKIFVKLSMEEGHAVSRDLATWTRKRNENDEWDGRSSREHNFRDRLVERFPELPVEDLTSIVDEFRWVKSRDEIEALRECARIGVVGYIAGMKATKVGELERAVAIETEHVFRKEGAERIAYLPIVSSGERTIDLHYNANDQPLEAGDVMLMDFAPDYNYYVVDITRTWPVAGKFSAEQLKIYECLLEAHQKMLAAVKPGVTIKELAKINFDVFQEHGYERAYAHVPGHFIGMSTHDPGFYDRPFVEGVVFNVEPLFIDRENKLHMRLEDTVVVTKDGCDILTGDLPMEVEELYELLGR